VEALGRWCESVLAHRRERGTEIAARKYGQPVLEFVFRYPETRLKKSTGN
jgi:hypothetical protein